MARTSYATNNALTKKVWEEKLFRDTKVSSYFNRFFGGDSSIVYEKTNLEKEKGDKITFGLRMRLTGAGVSGNQQLEGNEESLTTYAYDITLDKYRNAVRDDGALTRQRAMFDVTAEQRAALLDWGSEKVDKLCFDAIQADREKVFYSASGTKSFNVEATAKSAITATDKLTLDFIMFMKTAAKTGFNRTYIPLRPVKIDGKEHYVLLAHPDVLYDLKTSSDYKEAQREARERSKENPLFTGADAIWEGVIIHEHEWCHIAKDGGAGGNVPWGKVQLLGAQALCFAWGKRPYTVEEKFDYQDQIGLAWNVICAAGRPKFNNLTYGSFGATVARTSVSDS